MAFFNCLLGGGSYGAVDGNLAGVLVHLFHHELGSGVSLENGRVWVTFCEGGFGYLGGIIAGRVVSQRLCCQVLRGERALPF